MSKSNNSGSDNSLVDKKKSLASDLQWANNNTNENSDNSTSEGMTVIQFLLEKENEQEEEEAETKEETTKNKSKKSTNKKKRSKKKKEELSLEQKIRKDIISQWSGKEEYLILKEFEQTNQKIHRLSNEQATINEEIEIFENSLKKNTPLNFSKDHLEQRNQKKKSLQKNIDKILGSIQAQELLQEKNQNQINSLIPKSKEIENPELVKETSKKKESVQKLLDYLEEIKDKNKNIQQQILDTNSKMKSQQTYHKLEIG
ncbi:hypothetical protein M0813_30062 [Anaeramoeba flamelloides]|uniref:Uncharacterized protein n=1 Tax=Anaeramoeba flamelloides TaxID=1746091 RepID=A0ABQ8XMQ6_9EUKA|nr:hypothetical protein M0813_30062 [Anaeramoeba flamelloides]